MRFVFGIGVAALAAGIAVGCQKDMQNFYPPPPACETNCGTIPGGNTPGPDGGTGGEGGTGGTGATIEQTGTVHLIASPSFGDTATTPYAGLATIISTPVKGGGAGSAMYGGSAGTTFDLKGIASGPTWFLVQDGTSGGAGVLSTISYANLPVLSGFAIPVLDKGNLDNIASSLPSVAAKGGVSTLAAQIVLLVEHGGAPFKGVAVTGGSGNAQIAYDNGTSYSDTATATGANGTVILFNAALSGLATITLTDSATAKSYGVDVQTAPGTATILAVDLQ